MLGHDICSLLDNAGIERIAAILSEQSDQDVPGLLPSEMSAYEADRARRLLESILKGLIERPER